MPNRLLHAALAVLLVALPSVAAAQETLSALNDAVTRTVARPDGTATVEVTGTYAGTLTFQVFGLSWGTVDCTPVPTGTAVTSPAANATGKWNCPVSGWASVRVLMSAYTSGTANVRIGFGPGGGVGGSTGSGGGGDASAANQSTQITSLQLLDNAVGHLTGGAAGTSSLAAGGIYVLTPPTLTNGQQATLRLDATGALVTAGGTAGPTDTDDGSIAGAQVPGLSAALQQAWDGAVWRRVTFGVAGTPSTQVGTVQGAAGMTPLLVTATATNLDVQIGGSDTLTVASHAVTNAGTFAAQVTNPTPATATSYLTARISDGTSFATLASDATFGTSTYTEATTTGPVVGAIRSDVLVTKANTTNEATPLQVTSTGALWVATPDPCSFGTKLFIPINQTTGTQLFTGTASNRTYVCQLSLVSATAQNIALVSGTGTVCATSLGPMLGGTTAATGFNFAANGGIVIGTGSAAIAKSDTDADNICILMSSSGQLSGVLSYVVAPN